jgi:cobyric acid synthase CobQ/L-threonine-O-3-phosphate decarboxylase
MKPEPREELQALAVGVHGGADPGELARFGLRPEDVLDFSANVNPFGPSPAVRAAIATAAVNRYPDREARALRAALADALQVPADHILAGNGASELIWLVSLAFLHRGDRVLILQPTYGEYTRAAQLMGAEVHEYRAREADGFRHDAEAVRRAIAELQPRLVFLANPNNPTGVALPVEAIGRWAAEFPTTLFAIDEAYRAFAADAPSCQASISDNVLVLRSMTKDFALAGVRLGYALSSISVIAALAAVRPPWSVSSIAQAAGVAALADGAFLAESLARLSQAKTELVQQLQSRGVSVVPSSVHYFLAKVGDAANFREALLRRGVLVRDCASFGLPEYVRISSRGLADTARLLEAWDCGGTLPACHSLDTVEARHTTPAKLLMVQGTSSSVGKSLLVAALCRIYARRGLRVAPFKAQNMSNNAAVCGDGAEIGRAQAMQAQAAGIAPTADMNPILLKPEADARSQVIVLGRPWQTLPAGSFYRRKEALWPIVTDALARLRAQHDLVLIEGAGSPVELNLKSTDIVNMAVARHARCPILLAGDIDRGGIFPQLLGTLALLNSEERALVQGLIVNKFRGDPKLFVDGVRILEERGVVPVLGVVPYLPALAIPEEDAVALDARSAPKQGAIDIAVIQFPRIANFDDFDPLRTEPGVRFRFVQSDSELGQPHVVILPGTKSTMADLAWLRAQGLAEAIVRRAAEGAAIVGICGGYQMLGRVIRDPRRVESERAQAEGLGLLDIDTTFAETKATYQIRARLLPPLSPLGRAVGDEGIALEGYEIHMGRTESRSPWLEITHRNGESACQPDGATGEDGRIWGCYVHGLFANHDFRRAWLARLGHVAELPPDETFERSINRLADTVEAALDMRRLDTIIGIN